MPDYEEDSENIERFLKIKKIEDSLYDMLSESTKKKDFHHRKPAAPLARIVSEGEYEIDDSENNLMEMKIENKLLKERLMNIERSIHEETDAELSRILKRLSKLEAKTAFIPSSGVTVQEYDRKVVEINKKKIMEYIDEGRQIDPLDYAELESIDVELSLLCFDELISEDKIERA